MQAISLPSCFDNGAFSFWKQAQRNGEEWAEHRDWSPYFAWLEGRLFHPGRWAAIPDMPGVPSGSTTRCSTNGRSVGQRSPALAYGWADPDDYEACQALATEARSAGTQLLRTVSVRDPAGINLVVFDPAAFAERSPRHGKTWHLRYEHERLVALAAVPHSDRLEFTSAQFGLA